MNMKKWTLLVAMIGVLMVTAFANDRDENIKSREDQAKERRAYFKENIKPKVDAQRNKLDASISAEDKKEIERLRTEIMSQRLIENEFFFEARASHIKGEEIDEDLMLELKAQRIVIENLHDDAKIIANKYRTEIDELLASIKEDRKEWQENVRPQRGEFYGKEGRGNPRDGEGYRGQRGHHGGDGIPSMRGGFSPGSRPELGLVTFLLWDVNRG